MFPVFNQKCINTSDYNVWCNMHWHTVNKRDNLYINTVTAVSYTHLLVVNDRLIEQEHSYRFLGCDLSCVGEVESIKTIATFNRSYGTIRRTGRSVKGLSLIHI